MRKEEGFAYYNEKDEKRGIKYHYRYIPRTGKWCMKVMALDGTSLIPLKRKPRVITGLYKTRGNRKRSKLGRKPKGQQTTKGTTNIIPSMGTKIKYIYFFIFAQYSFSIGVSFNRLSSLRFRIGIHSLVLFSNST